MDKLNKNDFRFKKILEIANSFDGMMAPLAVGLFDSFLKKQKDIGIGGDCIEFGVYRGKSASVIAHNMNKGETIHLVDVADYPEIEKLQKIWPDSVFTKSKSEELFKSIEFTDTLDGNIRFSHHDASHFFTNVRDELTGILPQMKNGGIVVLDDFNNNFSQVIAGYFYHKFVLKSDLEILLISSNKAYLCSKADFPEYEAFIIDELMDKLDNLDLTSQLVRSENHELHRAFHIRPRTSDMPIRYGENIYGDRFYRTQK